MRPKKSRFVRSGYLNNKTANRDLRALQSFFSGDSFKVFNKNHRKRQRTPYDNNFIFRSRSNSSVRKQNKKLMKEK